MSVHFCIILEGEPAFDCSKLYVCILKLEGNLFLVECEAKSLCIQLKSERESFVIRDDRTRDTCFISFYSCL